MISPIPCGTVATQEAQSCPIPMQATQVVEFERQLAGVACTARAWAKVPVAPSAEQRRDLKARIRRLLKERSAVLLAHYYIEPDIQDLAEETGGCVADSLEMARFGRAQEAPTLVVAGVRFMGETAKILNPEKRVLMPELDATCSLDLGCPAEEFSAFCDRHSERTVVVYANTSAGRKFSGRPTGTWAPTCKAAPAPTC